MEREKGQTVTSMSCPNCGADTPLVAQPDGGMAQASCPNCFGTPEVASRVVEAKPKREKATEVAETGPLASTDQGELIEGGE